MKFITDQIIFPSKVARDTTKILSKDLDMIDGFFVDFVFDKLPYSEDALSKSIDEETMKIHHDKHHKKYFDNVMSIIDQEPKLKKYTLIELMNDSSKVSKINRDKFINNAGGHFNHQFFWNLMSPNPKKNPEGKLLEMINKKFKSLDNFKKEFTTTAVDLFGSGWVWLCLDNSGNLRLGPFTNQSNPHIENCGIPLLGCDVWEHAYYLKYKNDRESYVKAWFDVVDWAFVEKIFEGIK